MSPRILLLLFLVFTTSVSISAAQNCTSNTGYNSTLILPPDFSPSVDNEAAPDETLIRVVTPTGECVASLRYTHSSTDGQSTPIWGKDSAFAPGTGISVGDTLLLEIQLPTSDTWHSTSVTYTDGPLHNTAGTYGHDELYVLSNISTYTGPIARTDEATVAEDDSVTIDVLANDSEVSKIENVSSPNHGLATVTDNGTVKYVPNSNYNGSDSFDYTAASSSGQTATGSVTVTIDAVNDPPAFTSDPPTQANTSEEYRYVVEVSDADGDELKLSAATIPDWLHFVDNGDGTGTLAGTPTENAEGSHQIQLIASDSTSSTDQAFTIEVSVSDFVGPPPPPPVTVNRTLDSGWNLVGLPVAGIDSSRSALFPHTTANSLFGYDGSLHNTSVLTRGDAYWLHSETTESVSLRGSHISSVSIKLRQNWNLISPPSCNIPIAAVEDPNGIVDVQSIYLFQGGYQPADTLKPANGYWFKATSAGEITLDCNSSPGKRGLAAKTGETELATFSRLSIRDADGSSQELYFDGSFHEETTEANYTVPPIPPKEIFDVRFAGDRRAIDATDGTIHLQSSAYPVTVELSRAAASEGSYLLEELQEGEVVGTHVLSRTNTVQLTNSSIDQVRIGEVEQTSARETPESFQLRGNYPNPFNPTTNIQFSLPEQAEVTVEVFNVMGAKIMELPVRTMDAGQQALSLDASALGSGMYLYRVTMHTATNVQTRAGTMTLVK
jgi:hypothetical protein